MKTVIISNRLPCHILTNEQGKKHLKASSGGLVSALEPIQKSQEIFWIGTFGGGIDGELFKEELRENHLGCVSFNETLYNDYYEGFANGAIWPLFHYFIETAQFDSKHWLAYEKVNEAFCEEILKHVDDGDLVWIHDYHLMLLPDLLRKCKKNLKIGYFHHIPFPSSEVFRVLPWREQILKGLLGSDLIGFHTVEYARHFLSSVLRILGIDNTGKSIQLPSRTIHIGAFPLGIDQKKWSNLLGSIAHAKAFEKDCELYRQKKVVLGVDRLDYSKGIIHRLKAFELFLKRNPKARAETVLVQLCVPSRGNVEAYQNLRDEIEQLVGHINGQYSSPGHTPVEYLYRSFDPANLSALYRRADVCLVTPLRDGLNLVCKEYVACKKDLDGSLILSIFAGAASEMGEAFLVNPYSLEEVAKAIEQAFSLSAEERHSRIQVMQNRIMEFDGEKWAEVFLEVLEKAWQVNQKAHPFLSETSNDTNYQVNKSILVCDLDLFFSFFQAPEPTFLKKLKETFDLFSDLGGHVVFFSRHSSSTLDSLKLSQKYSLFAEGGCYLLTRRINQAETVFKKWESLSKAQGLSDIRNEVGGMLKACVLQVPGSLLTLQKKSFIWCFGSSKSDFSRSIARSTAYNLSDVLAKTSFCCDLSGWDLMVRPLSRSPKKAIQEVYKRFPIERPRGKLLAIGLAGQILGFDKGIVEGDYFVGMSQRSAEGLNEDDRLDFLGRVVRKFTQIA